MCFWDMWNSSGLMSVEMNSTQQDRLVHGIGLRRAVVERQQVGDPGKGKDWGGFQKWVMVAHLHRLWAPALEGIFSAQIFIV